MPKLTKRQFEEMFREDVLPHVIDRYEQDGIPDRPARREAWNNTVDAYIRDRQLPEAAGNWSHPRWLDTWRPHRAHATRARKKTPAQLDREVADFLQAHPSVRRDAADPSTELGGFVRGYFGRHPTERGRAHATRARKTRDIYVVQGNYGYGQGWEDLTAEDDRKEGRERLREYRENESGVPFRLIKRRERLAPATTAHARRRKLDPHEAKRRLEAAGIDFGRDFHELGSSAVHEVLDVARAAGYRKRKDAPGSTARMYFQYLRRLQ